MQYSPSYVFICVCVSNVYVHWVIIRVQFQWITFENKKSNCSLFFVLCSNINPFRFVRRAELLSTNKCLSLSISLVARVCQFIFACTCYWLSLAHSRLCQLFCTFCAFMGMSICVCVWISFNVKNHWWWWWVKSFIFRANHFLPSIATILTLSVFDCVSSSLRSSAHNTKLYNQSIYAHIYIYNTSRLFYYPLNHFNRFILLDCNAEHRKWERSRDLWTWLAN